MGQISRVLSGFTGEQRPSLYRPREKPLKPSTRPRTEDFKIIRLPSNLTGERPMLVNTAIASELPVIGTFNDRSFSLRRLPRLLRRCQLAAIRDHSRQRMADRGKARTRNAWNRPKSQSG